MQYCYAFLQSRRLLLVIVFSKIISSIIVTATVILIVLTSIIVDILYVASAASATQDSCFFCDLCNPCELQPRTPHKCRKCHYHPPRKQQLPWTFKSNRKNCDFRAWRWSSCAVWEAVRRLPLIAALATLSLRAPESKTWHLGCRNINGGETGSPCGN